MPIRRKTEGNRSWVVLIKVAKTHYSYTRFTLNLFSLFEDMEEAVPSAFLREFAVRLTDKAREFSQRGRGMLRAGR